MNFQEELVSIGLPTYNGLPYLKKAVESALNQTYSNIELIITDNPSTDGTQMFCEEYAKKDRRVKYIRHQKDIGAFKNYNSAFKNAQGKYYCWLSFDDYLDKYFIEKCVTKLREDKKAIMAISNFVFVNISGEIVFKPNPKDYFPIEKDLYLRLKEYILLYWILGKATLFHGLWRREAIANEIIRDLPDSDIGFIFRGLSRGNFLFVDEVLFYKGILPGRESREHEKLTFRRVISSIFFRIKLIPLYFFNMKYTTRIKNLSFVKRLKLIFWECISIIRMFVMRKY